MRPRSARQFLLLFIIVILTAPACSDNNNTTTTPTPTTPPPTTDTFSGTLSRNGAFTHQFVVVAAGSITATLTTVAPDSTTAIGFSLGTWNGSACQIVLANDKAAQGASILGTASGAGNYCARVYDVGNVVGTVSYEIQIVHP